MAFSIQLQPFYCSFNHNLPKNSIVSSVLPKNFPQKWQIHHQRQSANFQPSSWSYEFMESIGNQNNHMEVEKESIKKMEEEVRCILENEGLEPLALLELIDDIHRLGMGYRFQDSSKKALDRIVLLQSSQVEQKIHKNLHACALYFRLLRQHGYHVAADIFESFKDSNGNFSSSLAMDVHGMLSLYEASYLGFDGENTLDEGREFTSFHLKNMIGEMDKKNAMRVSHALELPFHHRMQRLEARWNIEIYDKQDKASQLLHQLAIFDFNMVQSVHQRDLQEVLRWWRHVGLANKLSFARDRLMESFFSMTGMVSDPQYSKCRVGTTKVLKLITVLDDIYDAYGSPEELEQLTDAVDKWDVNAVNHLPDYMRIFFFALYNTVNDLAYDTLKEQDQVVISQLAKPWADLCKAFLSEAKWSYEKHIPTFDEYLENGWISSSVVVILTHAYFLMTQTITDEAINALNNTHGLLRYPCSIFRLANDLCFYKEDIERGEVAKAVPCYMHETGSTDEVAHAYIRKLIDQNWKMINKEITYNSIFDKSFIETASNFARLVLCLYEYGDSHTAPTDVSRNQIKSMIIEPIHFVK